METTDIFDRPVLGEVSVRPFAADGSALADPMSIFASQEEAVGAGCRVLNGQVILGNNLVVDLGRQTIANLIGGRDFPAENWVVRKISFGLYDEAPRFSDVSLSPQPVGTNEIEVSSGVFKKALLSVDWPQPFITRFEGILAPSEGNGLLIREMGLWTYNNTLFARKTFAGINKSSDFGLSVTWLVRC